MAAFGAVLDACVLVPAASRDTLLRAAVRKLYRPYWTDEILLEVHSVLVRQGMTTTEKADYLIATITQSFPTALVHEGYRELIPVMTNDPKDRHVLAAAVYSDAQTVITSNLKDFPAEALQPHGIEAQSPATFLVHQFHLDADTMCEIVIAQARNLQRGGLTIDQVLNNIGRECPRFATLVRRRLDELRRITSDLSDTQGT